MITPEEKIRLEKSVAGAFSREDWEWLCERWNFVEVVDAVTSGETALIAILSGLALMELRHWTPGTRKCKSAEVRRD